MRLYDKIGKWNIYVLGGIRTERTGQPDEIMEYYVAFDGIHMPLEGKTVDTIKARIAEIELI